MNFWSRWFSNALWGQARMAYGGMPMGSSRRAPSARRGCSPRIILALLVIGGSVFMHFIGTTKYANDFTGREQRLKYASKEEEVALGLQSAPQMIREMGGEHPDRKAQALVDQVGERLVASTAVKDAGYQFDFHLLDDDQTVNAFALPGGQIFITSALFSRLESEDQLAGVLGHEIGHVVGRHSNEQMAKQGLIGGIASGVGILLSDGQSLGGQQVAQMVAQVTMNSYGRGDELESDKLGVHFMTQAGYNPEALIGVMEILEKASGGGGQPEFMSTHPSPANRVEKIKEEIAKMRQKS